MDRFLGRLGAKSAEDAAAIVMASAADEPDRAELERVEQLAEQIAGIAEKVQMLQAHRADVDAGIVRKCGPSKIRVRSVAKLLPDAKPRPDLRLPR
jgi:hypothetical protein